MVDTSYNTPRAYVGRALSNKSTWPNGPQQNLSKSMEKRDDFAVWPGQAPREKDVFDSKRVKSLVKSTFPAFHQTPLSTGRSGGSADQPGGPLETLRKRDVFEGAPVENVDGQSSPKSRL